MRRCVGADGDHGRVRVSFYNLAGRAHVADVQAREGQGQPHRYRARVHVRSHVFRRAGGDSGKNLVGSEFKKHIDARYKV